MNAHICTDEKYCWEHLTDKLEKAEKEATRLSNYETAYNNLQRVVRSQYNDIDVLTIERDLARADGQANRLGLCPTHNATIRCDMPCPLCELIGFEQAVRETRETIDAMRAEGCAAAGALENIFNDVTIAGVRHSDPTIARVAQVASLALVDVPRCEHKATFEELLPAIIFGVVYYDLGEHGITWKVCVERWERYWKPALLQAHSGDCTNDCQRCARCQAEDVMRLVRIIEEGLADG